MATATYKDAVFGVLRSRRWTPAETIQEVGGADGLRRLREIRSEGFEIKMRPAADGSRNEYRLVSTTPSN
jgi:hypothetical protein